jgi:hypothetical protein
MDKLVRNFYERHRILKIFAWTFFGMVLIAAVAISVTAYKASHANVDRDKLREYESRRDRIVLVGGDRAELEELDRRIGQLKADGVKDGRD